MTEEKRTSQTFVHEVKSIWPWHGKAPEPETITAGEEPQTVLTRHNLRNTEEVQVGPDGLSLTRIREDGRVIDRRYRRSARMFYVENGRLLVETVRPA
ncbi:MAG: hypothetical protein ABSE17_02810 [Candidatus Levyibacteriota bacterium]|jgi:hypothetical protein